MSEVYYLTESARADLADIYAYTNDTWGEQQAQTYVGAIFQKLDAIGQNRAIGRPIPLEFGVTGLYHRHKQHMIFWRPLSSGLIGVAAVLHVAMAPQTRLPMAFDQLL